MLLAVLVLPAPVFADGGRVSIWLDMAVTNCFSGGSIMVTLVISNRTHATIPLATSTFREWDFPIAKLQVTNLQGGVVKLEKESQPYLDYNQHNGSVGISELLPGAVKTWQLDLAQRYAFTNPGTYAASAQFVLAPDNPAQPAETIESKPVIFKIRPPP